MTIECPQCHYKNPDDVEFCEQCGAQLPVSVTSGAASAAPTSYSPTISSASVSTAPTAPDEMVCPQCKAPFAPGDQFCFNCGADLRAISGGGATATSPAGVPAPPDPSTAVAPVGPVPSPVPANDPFADDFAALDNGSAKSGTVVAPILTQVSAPTSAPPELAPAPALDPSIAVEPAFPINVPRVASTSPLATPPPPVEDPVAVAPTTVTTFTLNVNGPHGDEVVTYPGREMLLGRRDPRTRVFPDLNLDDSATSRRHLALWIEDADGQVYIQDLESANGTSLNGRDLEPGTATAIHDGDTIKLGTRYSIKVTFG